MAAPLTIWLLNPYHSGSHRAWAEGYAAHSRHRVTLLAMAGQFWKWRLQGAALELAQQARLLLTAGRRPDLLLATSMTNLPAFLALTRRDLGSVPVVLYMHENQLTYPLPPGGKRDLNYAIIQHLSMLAADCVCFNSAHHLRSWFDESPRLLKHFPDYSHLESLETARARSVVLPVGCDLHRFDGTDESGVFSLRDPARPPLILWNQRWEYDKDPGMLLRALYALVDEGISFRVALVGENNRLQPTEFLEARERLGTRLTHFGYVESAVEYARLLRSADVVLSTAVHEFFGIGVAEAIYCGAQPVLPARLSYPELLPPEAHARCLYRGFNHLVALLRAALTRCPPDPALKSWIARFDWSEQGTIYDELMADVAARSSAARTTTPSA